MYFTDPCKQFFSRDEVEIREDTTRKTVVQIVVPECARWMRTRVDDANWYLVSGTDPRAARAGDGHVGWVGGSREHLACGRF